MRNRISPTAGIMFVLLIWQVFRQLECVQVLDHNSWGFTDWMVNYSGGFVRRGLGGTLIQAASRLTELPANHLITAVSLTTYVGLISWFISRTSRHFPAALLLSCLLLGFPAYQDTIIRKDTLLLLLWIACLKCHQWDRPEWRRWAACNGIACFAILLHETFAFFSLPALIFLHPDGTWRGFAKRGLFLLPSLACFALVTHHHGNPAIAQSIHDSWRPLWESMDLEATLQASPFATIQSIGWTSGQGVELTKGILQTGLYQPISWLGLIAVTTLLTLRFMKSEEGPASKMHMIDILGLQLLFIAPLFLLGIDYGRWLFLWLGSSMILFTYGYRAPEALAKTSGFRWMSTRISQSTGLIPRGEWVLLCLGTPVLWSARNFLTASPAGRVLDELLRGWFPV